MELSSAGRRGGGRNLAVIGDPGDDQAALIAYASSPGTSVRPHPGYDVEQPPQQQAFAPGGAHIVQMFVSFCTERESYGAGWRGMMNRFVAWRGNGMYHVEPVFVWSNGAILACHCTAEGPVAMWQRDGQRSYPVSRWTTLVAEFSPQEMNAMYQFCLQQYNKPYNWRGFFCNFLPVLRWFGGGDGTVNQSSWLCSELMMAALKHVRPQEFAQYTPATTTVSDLYQIMRRHRCFSPMIATLSPASTYDLRL